MAIGDSLASGEGNPGTGWTDTACHRSHNAWPEQVARNFVENYQTTVTFLSYACSGANLENLYRTYQNGAPPQVVAARWDIGAPKGSSTRRIDALLLSVGVNDLGLVDKQGRIEGFSSILKQCALTNCQRDLSPEFARLPGLYAALNQSIRANLKVAHVYAADYPAWIFTNAAGHFETCGVFDAMSNGDASWVATQGLHLDQILATAAARYNWRVTATSGSFLHHGYCAGSASWYRSWSDSYDIQGDDRGTAHPTYNGHYRIAQLVSARVKSEL